MLLAGLWLAGGLRAEPACGPAIKAKLTVAPLSAPQAVLARPGEQGFQLFNGIVFMGNMLQFDANKQQAEVSLGGGKVVFRLVNSKDLELKHQGGTVKLEREQEMSYRPVTAELGGGRSYVLAFPYGYVREYESGPGGAKQTMGFLLCRSGSVEQFSIDEQTFCIFDSNTDGYYRLADDALGVGAADGAFNVFAPATKFLATRSGVYQIRGLAEDGSELEYARCAEKTGTISVGFAAPESTCRMAFASAETQTSFVAAPAELPAQISVLPGKYDLVYGLVYSSKAKKAVAAVAPGKLAATEAAADQTRTIAMGSPFSLEFAIEIKDEKMSISSATFHLRGKAGEEYTNFRWSAEPEISVANGPKTIPVGKMEFG